MVEEFLNLKKETDIQVQEAQNPKKRKPERPRHIVSKMAKVKDKEDSKDSQRKTESHTKEPPIRF